MASRVSIWTWEINCTKLSKIIVKSAKPDSNITRTPRYTRVRRMNTSTLFSGANNKPVTNLLTCREGGGGQLPFPSTHTHTQGDRGGSGLPGGLITRARWSSGGGGGVDNGARNTIADACVRVHISEPDSRFCTAGKLDRAGRGGKVPWGGREEGLSSFPALNFTEGK